MIKNTKKYAVTAILTVLCLLFCGCADIAAPVTTEAAKPAETAAATEAVVTAADTEEPATERPETEKQTEPPADAPTEARTETQTEAQTDPATESKTEPPTEPATEPATEPPATEPAVTEPPQTEPPQTEPPTEPVTEPPVTEPPVTEPPKVLVTSITVNAPSDKLQVGKTMQLSAAVKPDNADDKTVKWSVSSGSSYAKISSDGVLTGVKAGKCTVKAAANDGSGRSATKEITITEPSDFEGSGTKSDPYLVKTADDLKNLSKYVSKSGLYFKQTADIDLSSYSPWTPVGNEDKPFKNNYDGGGYKITNLKLKAETYNAGLFGVIKKAEISNVTLENVTTEGRLNSNSGCLVGVAYSSAIKGCAVSGTVECSAYFGMIAAAVNGTYKGKDAVYDCRAAGTINASGSYVGGLVGRTDIDYDSLGDDYDYDRLGVDITSCRADVNITGGVENVGGLIGYCDYVTVKRCSASGSIEASATSIGGLIGQVYNTSEVYECCAGVDVRITGSTYGGCGGGLIGYAMSRCKVRDCYATGSVENSRTWSDCQDSTTYNGGLFMRYRNPCGSLIGMIYAVSQSEKITVYNCYATGAVNVPNVCTDGLAYCKGSLIGIIYDTASVKLIKDEYRARSGNTWNESYNIDITEDMMNGNMIGKLENNYCVSDFRDYYTPMNYIVKNKNGTAFVGQYKSMPTYKVVNNIEASAVGNQSTFAGFDFSSVWKMTDDGPKLRNVK